MVNKPTRARGSNQPNLLDLVLTNNEELITNIDYQSPLGKSDHSVLVLKLDCNTVFNIYKKTKYLYDRGDYVAIGDELDSLNWETILSSQTDINNQWSTIHDILTSLQNRYVPNKIIICNGKTKGKIPLDKNTREKIKEKHKLWKKYNNTKDPKVYREFCKSRNRVRKLTRHIQKQYETKLAKEAKLNPKAVWKYVKSKTNIQQGVSDLTKDPNDPSSELITSNKGKAQINIGRFFCQRVHQGTGGRNP